MRAYHSLAIDTIENIYISMKTKKKGGFAPTQPPLHPLFVE
jgi:hypothetical protein